MDTCHAPPTAGDAVAPVWSSISELLDFHTKGEIHFLCPSYDECYTYIVWHENVIATYSDISFPMVLTTYLMHIYIIPSTSSHDSRVLVFFPKFV